MAKTALVIDDEQDIITYETALLSDHGWNVRSAQGGDEGLDLARQEKPDVVLLDVMMPERGGLSTFIAFRKDPQLKDVPVVLVTGIQETLTSDFETFLARAKRYNPDGFIAKPIDQDLLLKTVEEVTS